MPNLSSNINNYRFGYLSYELVLGSGVRFSLPFVSVWLHSFVAILFCFIVQRRFDSLLKEKEELSKENQALSRQLEEVRQGSQLVLSSYKLAYSEGFFFFFFIISSFLAVGKE